MRDKLNTLFDTLLIVIEVLAVFAIGALGCYAICVLGVLIEGYFYK